MARILFIVVILIVHGSLYPWDFTAKPGINPFYVLLASWPPELNRWTIPDIVVNVLIYAPLGIFGYLAFGQRVRSSFAVAAALGLGLALSSAIEMLQVYDRGRVSSCSDVLCNVAGAAAGIILARMYQEYLTQFIARPQVRSVLHPSAAVLLLLFWLGYQTFPLLPRLSRTQLLLKIRLLWAEPSLSAVEVAASVVDWLGLAALLEVVFGQEKVRKILGPATLVVPARLLIAGRSIQISEWMGAAVAWGLWNRGPSRLGRPRVLAWLCVGALALRGLAPFHLSNNRAAFTWIPFAASLSDEYGTSLVIMFRKCFLYGLPLWLFRRSGGSYLTATIGVSALLASIELVQLYLPGRTAESTDPLLAIILGITLKLLSSPRPDNLERELPKIGDRPAVPRRDDGRVSKT